jgi:hypothetical protein
LPAAVYTRRFFLGQASVERTTVTVPLGHTWVIRNLEAYGPAATGAFVSVGGTVALEAPLVAGVSGTFYVSWEGRIVAADGEQLNFYCFPAAASMCVTGYDFMGV